jgi:hypothetical protein
VTGKPHVEYCIDTSSLIRCARDRPFDIDETVWKRLHHLVEEERLICPREVIIEIEVGDDVLARWIKKNAKRIIRESEELLVSAREVQAAFPNWIDKEKEHEEADPFLIALALVRNKILSESLIKGECFIVTEESTDPNKLRIPRIARYFGLKCMNLHDFFRSEGWKF